VTHIRHSAHSGAAISCAARVLQASKNQSLAQPSRWWNQLGPLVSLLLAVFLSFHCALSSAQQTANYIYDELGRLKTVVAPNGDRAEYDYDAVGNLLAVRRIGTNTLAVSEITPNVGTSGTVVTIRGAGFSATPASNTVKFNGVAATVTTATTTQLTVAAPATGTTGTISVTVAAATATSQEIFTYVTGTTVGGPTITSFSPVNGPATTQVTIIGTNFELAPGATKVELNGISMPIVSLTTTQIVAKVPADVASGKIRVITPKGIAVSTAYFYVPIPNYADADIIDRQSITIGGAASTVNVSTANKYGLLLFDGAQNDYVSMQLSAFTNSINSSTSYYIYKPDNTLLGSGNIYASLTLHIPRLTLTGTYSIVFAPGAATTSLTGKLTRDGALIAGAIAIAANRSVARQSLRYSFSVAYGATLGVGLTGLTYTPTNAAPTYMILYKPDGTSLSSAVCDSSQNGCNASEVNATTSGVYSVVITPPADVATANFSLLLSNPVVGALTIDNAVATSVALTRAGQNARYTFTALAGQSLGLGLTELVFAPNSVNSATMAVYFPNGDRLNSNYSVYPAQCTSVDNGCTFNLTNLAAGTYSVVVSTTQAATANFKLQLNNDVLGTLAINASTNLSLKPGQNGRYTFSGSAGQSLDIETTQLTTNPSGVGPAIYIYRPSDPIPVSLTGTTFDSPWKMYVSLVGSYTLPVLPETGTYTIIVDENGTGARSTSFTLKLRTGTAITTSASSATTVSTSATSPTAHFSFDVALGQNLGIGLTGLSYSPTGTSDTKMTLYKPDGYELTYVPCSPTANGCKIDLIDAAVAGTYSMTVAPPLSVTSANFSLLLSAPVSGVLTVDSPTSTPVVITRAGQSALYTFTATAGQNLGIGLSDFVIAPNTVTSAQLTVSKPDGLALTYTTCSSNEAGCALNLNNLPAGTYTVRLLLDKAATGSFKLQVNSDTVGALAVNAASSVSLKPGQNARYTFSGTTGQSVNIEVSQLVTVPANRPYNIYVYRPSDSVVVSGLDFNGSWNVKTVNGASAILSLPSLPETGTYTVVIDDYHSSVYSNSASATFALKLSTGDALIPGGASGITTIAAGQSARFTFDVAIGQTLGIGLTGFANTPVSNLYSQMTVYGPNGVALTPALPCSPTNNSCKYDVVNATVAGTYSVVVVPPSSVTSTSFSLLLSVPVSGVLTVDSATTTAVATTRAGQNARYTFTAVAGQNLGIGLSELTIPSNSSGSATMTAYLPSGTKLGSTLCKVSVGGCALNLNNAIAGTYSVVVSLTNPATGSFKLQVNNDVVGTLVTNTAANVNVKLGQNARYTFSGSVGQILNIELAQLVTNPLGREMYVYVFRPTDTVITNGEYFNGQWTMQTISGTGGFLSLPPLPTTGTYTVIVDDNHYVQAYDGGISTAAAFTLRLKASQSLTLGAAATSATTTAAGQTALFTFNVALGDTVGIGLTGLTYSPTSGQTTLMKLVRADGVELASTSCNGGSGCSLDVVNANVAGTYSIIVVPPATVTSTSFSMLLSAPVAGALTLNAASGTPVTIARAGQSARYTFAVVAGQNLGIGVSEFALVPEDYTAYTLSLYLPTGEFVDSSTCASGNSGCALNILNSVQGTYSILVSAEGAGIGSFKLQVNSDAAGALTANVPVSVVMKPGQNVRYTFSGTAGQSMNIDITQLLTSEDRYLKMYIYGPTDTVSVYKPFGQPYIFTGYWQAFDVGTAFTAYTLPSLPSTGTYTVIIEDPRYAVSASFMLKARTP
jgi:trimeric autotransporter adhesin